MPFNSYAYFVFLTLFVIVFWQLPPRFRPGAVLAVSLLYYASWNPIFIVLPIGMAFGVYVVARLMIGDKQHSRRWLWVGVVVVLAILAFFKYRLFFLHNLTLLGPSLRFQPRSFLLNIGIPLGISFYTFECISYLIDVRQGRITKPDLFKLCNFVTFWPHLMAGPIVRVRELVPQLSFRQRFRYDFLYNGLDRLIWGLVQKNVIANPIGQIVDQGFTAGAHSSCDAWFLAIAFGFQIYFDFSGYTNMALGAAQLLGITLPENFRFPYHASNPADFWSRWHMTLSRWIRDYLFFPITAKYKGAPLPLYVSLLAVMALVGLWHGAGWGFVIWGIMHGCYLVAYRIFEAQQNGRLSSFLRTRAWSFAWRGLTLIGVTAAWVPFRSATVAQAVRLLESMFFRFSGGTMFSYQSYGSVLLVAGLCIVEPHLSRFSAWARDNQQARPAAVRALLTARLVTYVVGLTLFMVFDQQNTQFIYFQF